MSGSEAEERQARVELAGVGRVPTGVEAERDRPAPAPRNALADQPGDDDRLGRPGRASTCGAQDGKALEGVALMETSADGAPGEREGAVGDAVEVHRRRDLRDAVAGLRSRVPEDAGERHHPGEPPAFGAGGVPGGGRALGETADQRIRGGEPVPCPEIVEDLADEGRLVAAASRGVRDRPGSVLAIDGDEGEAVGENDIHQPALVAQREFRRTAVAVQEDISAARLTVGENDPIVAVGEMDGSVGEAGAGERRGEEEGAERMRSHRDIPSAAKVGTGPAFGALIGAQSEAERGRDASLPRDPARVADRIAETLAAHGARAAFGMPGGEVVTLVDALGRAGIRFHLARHETQAALMAAGESAVSGAPGLLVTTLGPGLANAVNGIADAAQEHAPLIVISGVVDRATRGRYTHQVIDHARLLAPLVKGSFEIGPEGAAAVVARAIRLATTAPMGPVHLDLSPEVAATASPEAEPVRPARCLETGIAAGDPAIREIAARLDAAERPLVIAGFEAARHPSAARIRAFLEGFGAPVITTYKAKGLISEDRAPALGAAGLSPRADALLGGLVDAADLILLLGYDPIEMRAGWLDSLGDPRRIIAIGATPPDHGMHATGLDLTADPARASEALDNALRPRTYWPGGEPEAVRARLTATFAARENWGPLRVIEVLGEAAGEAIVTVDSGAHRILLSQKWVARRPLRLLQSAGFCTMAAALPLAIGAAVAAPGQRVIAVMGDGGLEMGIGELGTLRDLGLPVTIVVFQDRALALIALKQAAAGLAPSGVALGRTDFPAVARAFGGHGVGVSDAPAFARALREAERRPGFTLIACEIDADAYQSAF